MEKAGQASHAEATHESSKAESKYDAGGLEATYPAGGKARQTGLIGLVIALVDLHRLKRQADKADGRPPSPAL